VGLSNLKAAFQLFSPSVSGIYRFEIFSEIQKNLIQTIGTPVSYKLQKPKKKNKNMKKQQGGCKTW